MNGNTALHEAVGYEYNDVVELLLFKGADVSKVNDGAQNALHLAASQGATMTVKLLLQGNSGVGIPARECAASTAAYDNSHLTPLHHAVSIHDLDSIKMLLEAGADVNAGQEDYDPPLYTAVYFESSLTIVRCLLDHGASVSAVNVYKKTTLHLAAKVATKEIMGLLLKYVSHTATVDMQDSLRRTALHYALSNDGADEIVVLLLDAGASVAITDEFNETPLHYAARDGNENSMRLLLKNVKQTSDLDIQTPEGRTALHTVFHNDEEANAERIVALLLEAGASVSITNQDNETSLHLGACKGDVDSVRLLLRHVKQTSDLDIQDSTGRTALHRAFEYYDDIAIKSIVALLLEAGASVSITDRNIKTPLHLAAKHGREKSMRLLLEHVKRTSDLDIQNCNGWTALHYAFDNPAAETRVALLLAAEACVSIKDYKNVTSLHRAARKGDVNSMRLLLNHVKQTSDLNTQRYDGRTPLHLALMNRLAHPAATDELVALLLDAGASAVAPDDHNETPLHIAARSGSVTTIRLLLRHVKQTSELNIREWRDGSTALHLAIRAISLAKVEMLLERGADLTLRSKDGCSALQLALESEDGGIRKLATDFVRANEWRPGPGGLFPPGEVHTRSLTQGLSNLEHSAAGQPSITLNGGILPPYVEPSYSVAPNFPTFQEPTNQYAPGFQFA